MIEIPIYVFVISEDDGPSHIQAVLSFRTHRSEPSRTAAVLTAPDTATLDDPKRCLVVRVKNGHKWLSAEQAWFAATRQLYGLAFRPACTEGVSDA